MSRSATSRTRAVSSRITTTSRTTRACWTSATAGIQDVEAEIGLMIADLLPHRSHRGEVRGAPARCALGRDAGACSLPGARAPSASRGGARAGRRGGGGSRDGCVSRRRTAHAEPPMRIAFLGHAGFCVETPSTILVTDPWLSPVGAFDSTWFRIPPQPSSRGLLQQKLRDWRGALPYISHEHKDHLDRPFLDSLVCRDFTLVLPDFRRRYLRTAFATCSRARTSSAAPMEAACRCPTGASTLYLDDSELNRDSALLLKAAGRSFLNLNDCRIFDALPSIGRTEGPIDVFACQFSAPDGTPPATTTRAPRTEAIARRKMMAKFMSVAQGIKALKPGVYLPHRATVLPGPDAVPPQLRGGQHLPAGHTYSISSNAS